MSWPIVNLEKVAQINPRLPKDTDESQLVTFLKMASVSEQGELLTQESRVLSETKKGFTYFEKNDILVAKITPCFENGKACLLNNLKTKIGFGSTEFHVIRANENQIDNKYLFYLVWNKQFRFLGKHAMKGAAGQQRISADFLKQLQIPLPPLKTQKQIAAVLEKADQLRKDCQLMEQELNSLAQSVFIDMFGDPVTNPKGWVKKPLLSLIDKPFQNGAYYPKEDYSIDGVEMVHMGDVFYDFVERGLMKRVKASKKDIEKYKLTSNDILISRRSLMLEGAAKPSLIQDSKEDLIFESSIIRLTPNRSIVSVMYLFYYLSNPTVKQHYIYQYITGATIKGINQKNLEKIEVLVPSMDIQLKFLDIEKNIRNQKTELFETKKNLDSCLNALMQKAFKGELNLDKSVA